VTRRFRRDKARQAMELSPYRDDEFDLEIGPHKDPTWEEDERLRAVWFANREQLLSRGPAGTRPWAWWRYESGLKGYPPVVETSDGFAQPSHTTQIVWLRDHGYLTVFEERELEAVARLARGEHRA
jgi:hypothetical protein